MMKSLSRLLLAAVSAAFFIASAQAQNAGTVTQNAFAIGKGAGSTGYSSLLCGSAQLAVGQNAAAPICQTITGDVTLSAAGVTALGNIPSGVTVAGSLLWTAIAAPATPAAGKENVWVDSTDNRFHDKNSAGTIGTTVVASTAPANQWANGLSSAGAIQYAQINFSNLAGSLACSQAPALTSDVTTSAGSCATTIAANAVTNAKMATMNAWTIKMNNTSGSAAPTDTTIDGLTLKASPTSSDEVPIWDAAASAMKKATVSSLASAGSVASVNGATGAVTIAAAGGETVNTTGSTVTLSSPGGFLNRIRNGTLDVWQRGTSALATTTAGTGVYTADGWRVQQTGAAFTCAQDVGTGGTKFSLQCVGGTSNTGTTIFQNIESMVAAPLAGATVTVQFKFKQDTGIAVTPKVLTCFASATDNFGSCTTDLASTSLTSCASGSWCTEAYTFNASASASNGYQVAISCNTALTSAQHCWTTAVDVRVTPGVTTGINSNPPAPELRPIATELAFCQRYYYRRNSVSTSDVIGIMQVWGATQFFGKLFDLPVQMRTSPTSSVSSLSHMQIWNSTASVSTNVSSMNFTGNSANSVATQSAAATGASLTAGNATMLQFNTASGWIDASAEL